MMEPKGNKQRRGGARKKTTARALSSEEISELVGAVDTKINDVRAKLARIEAELLALRAELESDEEDQDLPSQII